MIILLSPAKSLDFDSEIPHTSFSVPQFLDQSEKLISKLKQLKPVNIKKLMNISNDLAGLNFQRYQDWHKADQPGQARQAVYAYKGDVYIGLDAYTMTEKDIDFANKHLRILSGLYGILKPTDLILPHRLEMGTKIKIGKSNDLYQYWKTQLTNHLEKELNKSSENLIINLASVEYSKSIDFKQIGAKVITPVFKDYKNGDYRIISFFAKKARGMLASYLIRNQIMNSDHIRSFNQDGYHFNNDLSTDIKPVFTRN